ncbi:MAG: hypothetical protein IJT91_02400 [Clostridia bacterium]|nr:hypothetical protein [Clostridia bacterium]
MHKQTDQNDELRRRSIYARWTFLKITTAAALMMYGLLAVFLLIRGSYAEIMIVALGAGVFLSVYSIISSLMKNEIVSIRYNERCCVISTVKRDYVINYQDVRSVRIEARSLFSDKPRIIRILADHNGRSIVFRSTASLWLNKLIVVPTLDTDEFKVHFTSASFNY